MKTDACRLGRIVELGERLLSTMDELRITRDSLSTDYRAQWLVSTPLFDIGEQVNCLSREITEAHPGQPWASIADLRHRLVHNYEGTNWEMVSSVLFEELKPFVEGVKGILAEMDG